MIIWLQRPRRDFIFQSRHCSPSFSSWTPSCVLGEQPSLTLSHVTGKSRLSRSKPIHMVKLLGHMEFGYGGLPQKVLLSQLFTLASYKGIIHLGPLLGDLFGECNMSSHAVKWDWVEALRAISWFSPALSSLLSQQLHILVEGDVFLSLDLGRKEPLGSTRASLWLPYSVSEKKKDLCCWKPMRRGTWMLPQHSLIRDDS